MRRAIVHTESSFMTSESLQEAITPKALVDKRASTVILYHLAFNGSISTNHSSAVDVLLLFEVILKWKCSSCQITFMTGLSNAHSEMTENCCISF